MSHKLLCKLYESSLLNKSCIHGSLLQRSMSLVHPCQTTQPLNSKQRNPNSQTILLETSHNWDETQPPKTIYLSLKIFSTRMRLIYSFTQRAHHQLKVPLSSYFFMACLPAKASPNPTRPPSARAAPPATAMPTIPSFSSLLDTKASSSCA